MSSKCSLLILVQSGDQFRALLGHGIDRTGACVVGLSSSLSLARRVEQSGLSYRPFTDYITSSEFEQTMREADRLSRTWFVDRVGADAHPDLLESVRLEVLQGFAEVLLAHRVLARVMSSLSPAQILLASGIDFKIAGVAAFEADLRGLPIQSPQTAARETDALAKGNRAADAAAKVLTLLRKAAHNGRLLARHRRAQRNQPLPVVLAFGAGVDAVNLQRLMPPLASGGAVRPVLVRAGAVDASMRNRPGQVDYAELHFLPLYSMLGARSDGRQCRRWLDLFRAGRAGYRGSHPFLFANPHLDPYFRRIFLHLMPHAQSTRQDVRSLLGRLHPALVLTGNEVSFPVRALVLEARRMGVPTLGLVHSGLNNMLYRDFSSDRLMVWGGVHVQDFVRVLNKTESQLVPIGNPQYDSWGAQPSERPVGSGTAGQRRPCVLAVTAVPQWHMYYIDLREQLWVWRELAGLTREGVDLIVKPHPRFDDYAFYESLLSSSSEPSRDDRRAGAVTVARTAYLEQVLPDCDLVVVPGFPTTAAVEAMLSRKAVVWIKCGFEAADFCTSIAPGCLVVTQPEAIVPAILEVLGDRERQTELIEKGQAFLDEFLGPRDGHAYQRMADVIAAAALPVGRAARSRLPGGQS